MAAAEFSVTLHHDDPATALGVARGLRLLLLAIHDAGDTHGCGISLTEPVRTLTAGPPQFLPADPNRGTFDLNPPAFDGGMLPGGPELTVLNTGRPIK